jgi:NADPH-dependent 2,4-dienoyl-CoA reductase/sulfur reductase-like enzyme
MTVRCDVLVAGAGPAGMAAAVTAAESGCRVLVIDENPSAGGQIWRGYASSRDPSQPHAAVFQRLAHRLDNSNIQLQSGCRIVAQLAPHILRVESQDGWHDFRYQRLILATGARELLLPFPGWTLPGVLGAGGVQALVKSGLPIAGKRVVLAGSGPLLLAVAASLAKHGAQIAGVFEQASLARLVRFGAHLFAHPGKLAEGSRYLMAIPSVPYRTGSWVVRADGDGQLRSVVVSVRGMQRKIACDFLGCGFHLVPNLELPRMLGCRIEGGLVHVDAEQLSSVADVFCAGELTGVGGLDKALLEGEIAGLAAAGKPTAHLTRQRDRHARFAAALSAAFALRPELRALADESTFVCRCEDVTHDALAGWSTWRDAKLHTRCGMGACQGRICGAATEFLFGWQNDSVRPPLTPARVGTLMAGPANSEEKSDTHAEIV